MDILILNAKIIDGSTTLIERWGFNQLGGVYIDVFPLDGMSDHKFMRKLQITLYRMINRWIYLYNRDPYKRGHNYTAWLPLLIQKVFSNRKLHQLMRKLQTMYDYNKATLVSEFVCLIFIIIANACCTIITSITPKRRAA